MMCPPSVKLSENFADTPSTFAEEGTYLHELCELKLHRYLGDMMPQVIEQLYEQHRDNDFYSDEAESVTDEYVAFCVETIEAVKAGCTDPLIMVEHRLDYSEYGNVATVCSERKATAVRIKSSRRNPYCNRSPSGLVLHGTAWKRSMSKPFTGCSRMWRSPRTESE